MTKQEILRELSGVGCLANTSCLKFHICESDNTEEIDRKIILAVFETLQKCAHQNAKEKGWWTDIKQPNIAEKIALIHSELSEALEAARQPITQQDKHCPDFSNLAIEFADAIIRIMDLCEALGLPLGAALLAKMKFNRTRPARHGGKRY